MIYNSVEIRIATLSDAKSIAEINVIASKTVYANILAQEFLDSLSVEKRRPVFEKRIQDPNVFCVVAIQNGKIVGFADFGPIRDTNSEGDAELYAIYILPEFQGRGIGHALFKKGHDEIKSRSFKQLFASVFEKNKSACLFYEALNGKKGSQDPIEILGQKYKLVSYSWNFKSAV